MAGEKYIIASVGNAIQIDVKIILGPVGYVFLGKCGDADSLLRAVRVLQPDFVIIDNNSQFKKIEMALHTIDEEMLCACIIIGENKDFFTNVESQISNVISICDNLQNEEIFINTISMAIINFKRIAELKRKLNEVTDNLETRKLVERAKYLLMEHEGINENAAYDKMRKKSMDNRLSMKSLAKIIISTYEK